MSDMVTASFPADGVSDAHSTRWRHMFCDNEPEHVQEFRNEVYRGRTYFGPAAGVRCEGCGRPTALDDWVQVMA